MSANYIYRTHTTTFYSPEEKQNSGFVMNIKSIECMGEVL